MTSPTELLKKTRKQFLSSLKNPDVSSGQLLGLLDLAKQQTPDLLNDYNSGSGKDIPSSDPIDWNAKYFSRHCLLAEHNFSHERIEHLIKVREYLSKKRVQGFVPAQLNLSDSQIDNRHKKPLSYEPSSQLKKFVAQDDLLTIRTALHMELNNNSLSSEDIRGALSWTKVRVPNLFEAYYEKAFAHGIESDRKLWDSQYYDKQIVYLKTNFSEERFLHLVEVRDLLRQRGVEGFAPAPPMQRTSTRGTSSPVHSEKAQNRQSQSTSSPVLKTALMVGGAVAALATLLIILINGQN